MYNMEVDHQVEQNQKNTKGLEEALKRIEKIEQQLEYLDKSLKALAKVLDDRTSHLA